MMILVFLLLVLLGLDVIVDWVEFLWFDFLELLVLSGVFMGYCEILMGFVIVILIVQDGIVVVMLQDGMYYLVGWLDGEGWKVILILFCVQVGFEVIDLFEGLCCCDIVFEIFWFNYVVYDVIFDGCSFVLVFVMCDLCGVQVVYK